MSKTIRISSSDEYISALRRKLDRDGYAKLILLSALLSAAAAYHLLIIYGHGNADAVAEGLFMYTGADWALACGRWGMRYMTGAAGKVIIPGLWVTLYALCSALSAIVITRLWGLRSRMAVCLTAVLLTVNPTVIEQSLLQYMFLAWGLSNVLSVLFVCFVFSSSRVRQFVLAPLCVAAAFGLYQSCISLMCLLFLLTLLLRLLDGEELLPLLRPLLRAAVAGLAGTGLYFLILKLELWRFHVEGSYRLAEFSLGGILTALTDTVPQAYLGFLAYFRDPVLWRSRITASLFLIALVCGIVLLLRLIREKKLPQAVAAAVLALLVPAAANIADIIFFYNIPVTIMQYQTILIIPFFLALAERVWLNRPSLRNLVNIVSQLLVLALAWTYVVSANATYLSYELSYRRIYSDVGQALTQVYALPDYSPDEVIAFAGFPDDSTLREQIPVYRYAYGKYNSVAFWDSLTGIQTDRRNYLLDYFGIDGGYVMGMYYNQAVQSEEFREMPVFPEAGSVRRFDGLILVKFSDAPPIID